MNMNWDDDRYDAFDVVTESGRFAGQIRLLYRFYQYSLDALGLEDLHDVTNADAYEKNLGPPLLVKRSIYYGGYEVYKLRPAKDSQIGLGKAERVPGCTNCGHVGVFIRTALFCPVHKTFIGGC